MAILLLSKALKFISGIKQLINGLNRLIDNLNQSCCEETVFVRTGLELAIMLFTGIGLDILTILLLLGLWF